MLAKVPGLAKPGKVMAKLFQSVFVRDLEVQRDIGEEEPKGSGAVNGPPEREGAGPALPGQ